MHAATLDRACLSASRHITSVPLRITAWSVIWRNTKSSSRVVSVPRRLPGTTKQSLRTHIEMPVPPYTRGIPEAWSADCLPWLASYLAAVSYSSSTCNSRPLHVTPSSSNGAAQPSALSDSGMAERMTVPPHAHTASIAPCLPHCAWQAPPRVVVSRDTLIDSPSATAGSTQNCHSSLPGHGFVSTL